MNINKTIALTALVAATVGISPVALAQDAGFYVGGAVGRAKDKDSCKDLKGDGLVGKCDDKDTSWKIFGGYQFTKYLGAELGYVDLGETKASGTILGLPATAKAEASGFELLGVGTIPINEQFAVYGKAGVLRSDVDVRATVAGVSVKDSDKNIDFTFGAGLKYNFTKNVAARLEFQRYDNVGKKSSTGQADINLWSLGAMFKF